MIHMNVYIRTTGYIEPICNVTVWRLHRCGCIEMILGYDSESDKMKMFHPTCHS